MYSLGVGSRKLTPPTERQLEIWSWMRDYQDKHLMPPTMREMCKSLDIGSTNAMSDHLKALCKKGLCKRHAPRGLRPRYVALPKGGS